MRVHRAQVSGEALEHQFLWIPGAQVGEGCLGDLRERVRCLARDHLLEQGLEVAEVLMYRFNMAGQPPIILDGREQVEPLYTFWAETNQSIFYNELETVAVGDWMVVSTMIGYQQTLSSALLAAGTDAEEDATCLVRGRVAMIWPTTSAAASSARTSGSTTRRSTG